MRTYKSGDPCPCCGQPIKTDNPEVLYLLSWIGALHRIPAADEIKTIHRLYLARQRQEAAGDAGSP